VPRAFLHYDVFTREPLVGNQLAVFSDGVGLSERTMQAIAREMNFSESTFILPAEADGTDVRMRIFTPSRELPMAGHPTIGSTFALAETGALRPGARRLVFGLGVGPTPVDLEWDGDRLSFAWMTQPLPAFGAIVDQRAAAASALGLAEPDLAPLPVQPVSCGVPYLLVPLRDRETVDRAVFDAAAFRRRSAVIGEALPISLFAVGGSAGETRPTTDGSAGETRPTTDGSAGETRPATGGSARETRPARDGVSPGETRPAPFMVYSRMFAPEFGIVEDPATGSASGPLGCYLVKHGVVTTEQASAIISDQGVAMGRASRIHIAVAGTAAAFAQVRVGGEAVLVGRGELLV
jgi:trans-2,3-dihydro-3-hydroxyanthranilate isomerase